MRIQFCPYCGTKLDEGARFCKHCGEAVSSDTQKAEKVNQEQPLTGNPTERETIYEGYIHKCPNCGEVLEAFLTVCPTCGYELRGVVTANSVREFAMKLDAAHSDIQRVNIIRNYPIPNTKEDILEFMILASTNVIGEQQKKVFDAWLVKFEQSYQKAQLVIKDSSDIIRIKTIYEKTLKQINKEKLSRNIKATGDTFSKLGNVLKKFIMLIGKSAAVIMGIVLFIMAINIDRSGGNSSMHELIGVILLIASAATLTKRDASFLEILIGTVSGGLSFYLANYLTNGSMLELGGAVVLILVAISFFKKLVKREGK